MIMKHNVTIRLFVIVLLGLFLEGLPSLVQAQSGKLAGTITDAQTKSPLPGATVLIQGTTTGAATDPNGRYVIVGITPGTYTLRVSSVGYTTKIIQNVLVTPDRTTTLNVDLSQEVIQGQEVTVEAQRPVVDPNQTTSRSLVTGQEMQTLPVTTLNEAISTTGNSYQGFVRGSKRYETKTVVDGIDISDDYYSTASSNYGGLTYHNTNRSSQTNASIFNLDPSAVAQASLNTGATSSAYPSATGGVVDVTLANRRGPISGFVSYRISPSTARPGPDSLGFYNDSQKYFEEKTLLQQAGDPRAALYTWTKNEYTAGDKPTQDLRLSFGGSITDKWNFMVNGQFNQNYGYQPNQYSKRLSGLFKTTYNINKSLKLEALGMIEDKGLWGNWANTSYVDFWRFYLQGVSQNKGGSYAASLKLTKVISPKSFVTVQAYRTFNKNEYGYPDDNGDGHTQINEHGTFINFADTSVIRKYIGTGTDRSKMFFTSISDPYTDSGILLPDGTRYKLSNPTVYSETQSSYDNVLKADYSNQLFENHFIQAGAAFKARTFNYNQAYGIDGIGAVLNNDPNQANYEPYVPTDWQRHPWDLALYASDRMEYAGLIVNLGMRVQFVNRDMRQIVDYFHPFVRDTITIQGRQLARNYFDRGKKIPVDVFWNPSIGVSHPISSTASMYFSYNRSEQLVPYSILYDHYDGNNSDSRFFTYQDPAQKPIISNNYELGVQWEFLQGWGLDVNAYMRSIQNYGRTTLSAEDRELPGQQRLVGTVHSFQTSFGYADVRGIEVVLRRRPIKFTKDVSLGLTMSYTYSSVESSVLTGENTNNFIDTTMTPRVLPFSNVKDFQYYPQRITGGTSTLTGGYDRTHRVVLRALGAFPYAINLGIVGTFESGFLYPKAVGVDPRDRSLLTAASNYQIDMRLEKQVHISKTAGFDVYMDITNLTNRKNVVAYQRNTPDGPAIFQTTGNPGSRLILNDGTSIYGPARNIFFGIRARF